MVRTSRHAVISRSLHGHCAKMGSWMERNAVEQAHMTKIDTIPSFLRLFEGSLKETLIDPLKEPLKEPLEIP